MRKYFLSIVLLAGTVNFNAAYAAHAFALYDTPKYPANFTHFDYVNPDAPKGGELYLANPDRRTSFAKYDPFSLKGVAAAGMKYSFDTLVAKGAPQFKSIFAEVKQCVVLGERTVRFDCKTKNRELPLIVGGVPVFSRKWGANTSFDKIGLETPIATGPYLIDRYDVGRSISYRRDPNYWGTDVPSRRGMFNFGRIIYRFYKDDVARLEAFKAGEFDVVVEYSAKNWARSYNGPKFTSGEIIKRQLAHSNGAGMQGFVMNLRRPQFQDIRVRQALGLALDFEWMNRQLFYGQYKRIYSFFNNSEMAATGVPSAGELKLLAPLRQQLAPAVFVSAPVSPSIDLLRLLRCKLL